MVTDYWLPCQKATFVTPAFPEYIPGHSTFSRAAAEVLAAITGTNFPPGGMGAITAPSNAFLKFEMSPSQTVVRSNTLRGPFYKLQSTPDLVQPFASNPAGFVQALDSSITRTNANVGSQMFYRAAGASSP